MTGNITWGTGDSEERKVRGKMAVGQTLKNDRNRLI
jgi:hypothetical protein